MAVSEECEQISSYHQLHCHLHSLLLKVNELHPQFYSAFSPPTLEWSPRCRWIGQPEWKWYSLQPSPCHSWGPDPSSTHRLRPAAPAALVPCDLFPSPGCDAVQVPRLLWHIAICWEICRHQNSLFVLKLGWFILCTSWCGDWSELYEGCSGGVLLLFCWRS